MDIQKTINSLNKNGYTVHYFEHESEAVDYLCAKYQNKVIGFGDSQTILQMKLYDALSEKNTVIDPSQNTHGTFIDTAKLCLTTEVFMTSVNAISETGELVNMDGTGNRVAGSLFGHNSVVFIAGVNKIESDLESAIWRVRNVASPLNAKRLKLKTPCALKGDKCYDCLSPQRICNALTIYFRKMNNVETAEVILINKGLGF